MLITDSEKGKIFTFTLHTTEPLRVDHSRFIEMTKENSQKLQYALNKFKMAELNMKNQLDLLQTSVEQRKEKASALFLC